MTEPTRTGAEPRTPLLAFTVDTEPDWGMEGTRAVRSVLPRLLDLLEEYDAEATFFVVSDMLEDCRGPLRRAAAAHEIASHGVSHRRLDALPETEFHRELIESRRRLEAELDVEVSGFRAPFLRLPHGWRAALKAAGYRYDSSRGRVYPWPLNPGPRRWKTTEADGIIELPTMAMRTGLIPFSLTYMRLLAPLGEGLAPRRDGVFYLHPHELADPALAAALPRPLRWILPRGAGEPAWGIVERLLKNRAGGVVSCRTWLTQNNCSDAKGKE